MAFACAVSKRSGIENTKSRPTALSQVADAPIILSIDKKPHICQLSKNTARSNNKFHDFEMCRFKCH